MIIREARLEDAPDLAKVQVDTWRTTYGSIVPDQYLAEMTYEEREQKWALRLSSIDDFFTFVVVDDASNIVGFVRGGLNHDNDPFYQGELHAIYILKEYQGKGIGRQLTTVLVKRLLASGIQSMLLWVFAENHAARRFYEALGGQYVKSNHFEISGTRIEEIAYGWTDIHVLLKECLQ